jgi:hypothetical protein
LKSREGFKSMNDEIEKLLGDWYLLK